MFTIQGNMTYKVNCDTYKVTLTIGYILIWVYIQGNMTYKYIFFIHMKVTLTSQTTYVVCVDMAYKTPQT